MVLKLLLTSSANCCRGFISTLHFCILRHWDCWNTCWRCGMIKANTLMICLHWYNCSAFVWNEMWLMLYHGPQSGERLSLMATISPFQVQVGLEDQGLRGLWIHLHIRVCVTVWSHIFQANLKLPVGVGVCMFALWRTGNMSRVYPAFAPKPPNPTFNKAA